MKNIWIGLEHTLGVPDMYIMNKENFSIDKIKELKPEIIIEREFNDPKYFYNLEWEAIRNYYPQAKRAMWFIDTHVQFARHLEYAKNFDYIFLAISRFVPIFQKIYPKKKVFWLPLCFPTPFLPPRAFGIRHKASFVGRWGQALYKERTEMVEQLKQDKRFFAITDYIKVYQIMSESVVSLNRSYSEDMPFRVFEALGCGSELVTNDVPDMHKIRGLISHVHLYKSDQEGVQMVLDLMDKKRKPKGDIESNRKFISAGHLLSHRVTAMIKMIENHIPINY